MSEGIEGMEEERYRAVLDVELERSGAATELSAWLKDPSWRVRKVAAERLAQVPDRAEALEVLLAALSERGEPGVRNAAAEALARMGPWSLGHVAGLLRHDDPDQRKFAAEILGQMGLPQAEGALLPLVEDSDPNVRAAAAEALGRVGSHESVKLLHRALAREDALLQLCALDALAALEAPPPLHTLVGLQKHPALRRAAFRLTAYVGDSSAAEVIARGLRGETSAAREAALGALGLLWQRWPSRRRAELESLVRSYARGLPDCAEWVREAFDDEDADVRRGAVFLSAMLDTPAPARQIAHAAGDPALAPVCAEVLSRIGSVTARSLAAELPSMSMQARAVVSEALLGSVNADWVPVLLELVLTADPELHLFAVRALGRTGAEAAVDAVVDALSEASVAHAAVRALTRLGVSHRARITERLSERLTSHPSPAATLAYARIAGPQAGPLLQKLRRDADATLRAAAVEGAIESQEGDEAIRLAFTDEAAVVRAAAARALGRVSVASAEPLLKLGLADRNADVRVAAIEAVAESGAHGAVPELESAAADADGRVAAQAIRALVRLGMFRGELLWETSRHPDPEVVKEVLQGAAASPDGEKLALSLLGHSRWDVRAAAARVLGTAGTSNAVPYVRTALTTELDPLVRQALAETVRVLGRR